ncbi:hypothetical protein [Mucilaginibacter ginsenosidivorax]|uniref:Nuclear transport factor 2 family protein n=1 Tax=Mucilaginibacter ginsenosidivorax TaxID=862126 RepID=A0A5B8VXF6_9SPHI|nr:hypothetical protein [Mucilaginibacter ginsenosidivorax]QEC75612.1 hypothetical protein FSB76_06500 [Mucilaginibacter ginsenosidivorax]
MAKDFKLPVSIDHLQKFADDTVSIDEFLSVFFGDDQNNANMRQGLASYFYDNGGSPEVREFDIVDAKFDTNDLTGSFKCIFTVYYFFTCSDIKNDKRENITWKFKIDDTNLTIAFVGEEPWVWDGD